MVPHAWGIICLWNSLLILFSVSITQNHYTQLAVLCQWMQVVKQVVPVSCKRSQIHLNSLIHPIPADRRQFLNGRIFVSQRSEWLSPCHHVHQVFSGLAAQHRFLQFDICTSAGTSLYIFVYSEYIAGRLTCWSPRNQPGCLSQSQKPALVSWRCPRGWKAVLRKRATIHSRTIAS